MVRTYPTILNLWRTAAVVSWPETGREPDVGELTRWTTADLRERITSSSGYRLTVGKERRLIRRLGACRTAYAVVHGLTI